MLFNRIANSHVDGLRYFRIAREERAVLFYRHLLAKNIEQFRVLVSLARSHEEIFAAWAKNRPAKPRHLPDAVAVGCSGDRQRKRIRPLGSYGQILKRSRNTRDRHRDDRRVGGRKARHSRRALKNVPRRRCP